MLSYLTDEWFTAVQALPSMGGPHAGPGLTVEHVVRDVPGHGLVHHWQHFSAGRLVAWRPGPPSRRDLIVRRTYEIDRDDLLGRGTADSIWLGTQLSSSVVTGDVFGLGDQTLTKSVLPDGLTLRFGLQCRDTPFGSLDANFEATSVGIIARTTTEVDVVIRAPYRIVLRWIHEDEVMIGHLISCVDYDAVVDGDLFRASALEAVVSTPRRVSTTEHETMLQTYAACRSTATFTSTMDAIDAFTR